MSADTMDVFFPPSDLFGATLSDPDAAVDTKLVAARLFYRQHGERALLAALDVAARMGPVDPRLERVADRLRSDKRVAR